jgi:hypothetical protein
MLEPARQIAIRHGEQLLPYSSQEEAEAAWFSFRNNYLSILQKAATKQSTFLPDYQAESLKQVEQWYFQLYGSDSFQSLNLTREVFEICMAMYFGETAVHSANAQWVVKEYFLGSGKYELGVCKGSMTMMLRRFTDYYREANNKRQQSLFRLYKKYFSR